MSGLDMDTLQRRGMTTCEARATLNAIADERRQTQRRMIAALYWRAGHCRELAVGYAAMGEANASFVLQDDAESVMAAAKALEAAL